MPGSPPTNHQPVPSLLLAGLSVAASLLVVGAVAGLSLVGWFDQALIGDPGLYVEIGDAILAGGIPYVDVPVEHLPMSLVPIIGVAWLNSLIDGVPFIVWGMAMVPLYLMTVLVFRRGPWDESTASRFVWVSLPLLPLALMRLEVWVVLLTVIAIVLWFSGSRGAGPATFGAVLTKGWPIAVLPLGWTLKHRMATALTAAASLVALAIVWSLPLFREGREFTGIHSETVVGSLLLLVRHLAGADPGVHSSAGAAYVDSGSLALGLNLAIGATILALAVRLLRYGKDSPAALMGITGLLTYGIILGSPLFSTQFVFWLCPFIAFADRKTRTLFAVASALSLTIVFWWSPSSPLWSVLVVGRNAVFIAGAVQLYRWIRLRSEDVTEELAGVTG